jgi:hypothetical protein
VSKRERERERQRGERERALEEKITEIRTN